MISFGANKLPRMGAGSAKGIQTFKNGIEEKEDADAVPEKIEEN